MGGIAQTCNHVTAALFRIEAAIRMGLTNPYCIATVCEWLPNNKLVKITKMKDLKLGRASSGKQSKNNQSSTLHQIGGKMQQQVLQKSSASWKYQMHCRVFEARISQYCLPPRQRRAK